MAEPHDRPQRADRKVWEVRLVQVTDELGEMRRPVLAPPRRRFSFIE